MPRDVPAALLAHFGSPYRTLCHCWAIKPENGDWEGFTSLDRNVSLPAFSVSPSSIPALDYLCAGGVALTSIPTRLNLSKAGIDVSVLAFERAKLLSGYYRGAEFEAFVINYGAPEMGRDVVLSGKIGNVEVGPSSATVELVPWSALAEMAIGRVVCALCDVGKYPGEAFGNGRCRNVTLGDGPLRADWSAAASVVTATSKHQIRVSFGNQALSGSGLPGSFASRLAEGDCEFSSGFNIGAQRSIKSASIVAASVVDLVLHEETPFLPSIGDDLTLVAGCNRTEIACKSYDNLLNGQFFVNVPGRFGVINQKND